MKWETNGQIMFLFSVVIFFGQIFQIITASAIAKVANDGKHVDLENALKVLILVLIPSLVGRVIAGAAWAFGRTTSSDPKKGNRLVALFETLWGNVLLLVLSAVSTFTTAIVWGAVSPKWSILYESRYVDSTNNIKFLVGSTMAIAAVNALETLYSHGKYFTRVEGATPAPSANSSMIGIVMFMLAVLMVASIGINVYFVVAVNYAAKLTPVAAYAAQGVVLTAALKRLLIASTIGLGFNGFVFVLYALKGCVTWFDRAPLARIMKLASSTVAVFAAAATYGGTLDKLTYIGIYEKSGKQIYGRSNNVLLSVTALAAVNFFLLFAVVSVAHILAFARSKL
jgi:hypothetical protein